MTTKTPEYYLALPYTRRVRLEADGADPTEAFFRLQSALEDYLHAMPEWGDEIPEPTPWPQAVGWTLEEEGAPPGAVTVESILP